MEMKELLLQFTIEYKKCCKNVNVLCGECLCFVKITLSFSLFTDYVDSVFIWITSKHNIANFGLFHQHRQPTGMIQ